MRRFWSLIYIIGIILVSSCRKDKPETIHQTYGNDPKSNYYGVHDSIKNWFGFKTGTYWVYENENSNAIESMFVAQYQDSLLNHFTEMPSTPGTGTNSSNYYYYSKVSLTGDPELPSFTLSEDKIGFTTPPYNLINPLTRLNLTTISGFDGVQQDSLQLATGVFYNLASIQYRVSNSSSGSPESPDSNIYYYNSSIGIIRKEKYLGNNQYENWNLVRWNIVR